MKQRYAIALHAQKGAVLVVGLIFLALLSLMGAVAYSVASQEERMAGNTRDRIRATEMAEAALRSCERDIATSAIGSFPTSAGFYLIGDPLGTTAVAPYSLVPAVESSSFWATAANSKSVSVNSLNNVSADPRCVAERFAIPERWESTDCSLAVGSGVPGCDFWSYRISARGVGINPNTVVTIQSTYLRNE